jgi:hypothetical protein
VAAPSTGGSATQGRIDFIENWAFAHRSHFFLLVGSLLTINIGYWVVSHILALGGWRPSSLPLESTSATAEIGLALGTLALAYAAALQAISAEKKRRGDLAPHLDLQILRPGLPENPFLMKIDGRPNPIAYDIFETNLPADGTLSLVVRNLGPGNAVKVRVVVYPWGYSGMPGATDGLGAPLVTPTIGYYPVVENYALKVNEDYSFPVPFLNLTLEGGQRKYRGNRQALAVATCESVEGQRSGYARKGLFLIGPSPQPDDARFSFKVMDDKLAIAIHQVQTVGIVMPNDEKTASGTVVG